MLSYSLPGTPIAVTPFYDKSKPLYCLVNFSQHPVNIDGIHYPTTEHFFQAQKFADPNNDQTQAFLQEVAKKGNGPADALSVAREWTKNWTEPQKKQWYAKNEAVMEKALRAKLEKYPAIAKELLSTQNSCLVEDTSERDERVWGWGNDGSGTNKLGKLWMKLRNELFTAQGKSTFIVDPDKLYTEVQKARSALGKRTTLMQTWPDVKPLQTPVETDNIFLLAADVLKQMQKGQSREAISIKGEKIQYGVSQRFGTFYMKGTDNKGRPIDVYVKNNQVYENNHLIAKSKWADWALPIVRKAITNQNKTTVAESPTPEKPAPAIPSKQQTNMTTRRPTFAELEKSWLFLIAAVTVATLMALKFSLIFACAMAPVASFALALFMKYTTTISVDTLQDPKSTTDKDVTVELPTHTNLLYRSNERENSPSAKSEVTELKAKTTLTR